MTISTFTTTAASLTLAAGGQLGLAPGTNQVVTDLKGWYSPAGVRRVKTDRLWEHGSFAERGWRDERVISLTGHIETASRSEAAALTDTLNALLADGQAGTFTVNDIDLGQRSASVYLSGTPTVAWDGVIEVDFAVDMIATDPRKYGPVANLSTPPAAPGGALAWNLFATAPGVLDFGVNGSPGTVTFQNPGTADTPPAFTVYGVAPGFTITEQTTGSRLIYAETVGYGHYVVLNARDGSVLLDGYADRGYALTRREWVKVPGSGTATFLFESPGASGASMSLGVQPAWF